MLYGNEEASECLAQFALGCLEFGNLFGTEVGRIDLGLGGFGAGLDHGLQGAALVFGIPLDGGYQIGNQVGTALINIFYLGPGGFYTFLALDEAVISVLSPTEQSQRNYGQDNDGNDSFFHMIV